MKNNKQETDRSTIPNLIILSDIESLLPPLSEEEFAGLKKSVQAVGIQDALTIWNGTLIDGHHRYRLAKELNLPFDTREMTFDSLDDAKSWIIENQSGRRNMTPYARTAIALKLKAEIAEKNKERQRCGQGGNLLPQNSVEAKGETREQIAQIANVSRDTVSRVEFIEENADDETKEALRRGEVSVNKVYNRLKEESTASDNTPPDDSAIMPIAADPDAEAIPEPVEPSIAIDKELLRGNPANPRERCVTLERISYDNPESLISALFDLFEDEYRDKFAEMFVEKFLHEKGKSQAEAVLARWTEMIQ